MKFDEKRHWREFWIVIVDPKASFAAACGGATWTLVTTHIVSGSHVHARDGETPGRDHTQMKNKRRWEEFKLEIVGVTCYAATVAAINMGRTPVLLGDFNVHDKEEQVKRFLGRVSAKLCQQASWRGQQIRWNSVTRQGTWILSPDRMTTWENPRRVGASHNTRGTYIAVSDKHDPVGACVMASSVAASAGPTHTEEDDPPVRHLVQLAERVWQGATHAWESVATKLSFTQIREMQLQERRRMGDEARELADNQAKAAADEDENDLRGPVKHVQDCGNSSSSSSMGWKVRSLSD